MGATAAAILIRKEKDLVEHFQSARATNDANALTLDALQIDNKMVFRRLLKRAVIRETSRGTYYLDVPSWNGMRETRRNRAFVIMLVALIILVLPIAVFRLFGPARAATPTEIAQ